MTNNKILISGITGFVGSNLKPYLDGGKEIVGVSRRAYPEKNIIAYQNLTRNYLDNALAFIHLAGKAHDLKKTTEDKEYFDINTNLTIKLFNQFLESDCKIFIFMSTVKAVADKVTDVLTEETIPNPITIYGKSKLKAEEYIRSHKIPDSKRVYILRPCMIHGPNNKGNLNLLYKIINSKIPFPLGRFNNKRSFLSIDNLCFIIEKLISKQPSSGVYNLADNETLSINELVIHIGETMNKSAKIFNVPKNIIKLVAKIGNNIPIPLNQERLEKLTETYCVSNIKIKKAIDAELPLTAFEGLKMTINSFKEK